MSFTQGANSTFLVQSNPFAFVPPDRHHGLLGPLDSQRVPRKPPHGAGILAFPTDAAVLHARHLIQEEIQDLRRIYGFPVTPGINDFLVGRPSIRAVLRDAIGHLQEFFGRANIFNLELSREEDGSQTLYAIAIWRNAIPAAARALREFEEHWWLDRMSPATAELAFTYEIA